MWCRTHGIRASILRVYIGTYSNNEDNELDTCNASVGSLNTPKVPRTQCYRNIALLIIDHITDQVLSATCHMRLRRSGQRLRYLRVRTVTLTSHSFLLTSILSHATLLHTHLSYVVLSGSQWTTLWPPLLSMLDRMILDLLSLRT